MQDKDLEKVKDRLSKWTNALLNGALDLFEVTRGSGDEAKKVRLGTEMFTHGSRGGGAHCPPQPEERLTSPLRARMRTAGLR